MEIGLLTLPISALVGMVAGAIKGAHESPGFAVAAGFLGFICGIACYFATVVPYVCSAILYEKRFQKRYGELPTEPPAWYRIIFLPLMLGIIAASAILSWICTNLLRDIVK